MSDTKESVLSEFLEQNRRNLAMWPLWKRTVDIYGYAIPDPCSPNTPIPIGVLVSEITTTTSKVVTVKCKCGVTSVSFDERDKNLKPHEIRSKWPRGHCNHCNMIVYANALHFVCGDW